MLSRIFKGNHRVKTMKKASEMSLRSYRSSSAAHGEGYVEKQERLGRPCSPDLEIYSLPPGAWSSIIVGRISGITMWGGMLFCQLFPPCLKKYFNIEFMCAVLQCAVYFFSFNFFVIYIIYYLFSDLINIIIKYSYLIDNYTY